MKKIVQGISATVCAVILFFGIASIASPNASAYTGGGCGPWWYGVHTTIAVRQCIGVTNGYLNAPYKVYWTYSNAIFAYDQYFSGSLYVRDDSIGYSYQDPYAMKVTGSTYYSIWNSSVYLSSGHSYHSWSHIYASMMDADLLFIDNSNTYNSAELYN